jgi:pyruvate dehydrogenase E2 component (dihydrolipoamide acetyltransferase)
LARDAPAHTDHAATNIRKVIAARLLDSKRESPHLYVSRDATLCSLLQLRSELAAKGAKASVNDFVIRAAALALSSVPAAGALAPGAAVDIAVAVALPDGGLITPVVRGADKLARLTLPLSRRASHALVDAG